MEVIYFRFHKLYQEHCDSIEGGKSFIEVIQDNGSGAGLGIFDKEKNIFYHINYEKLISSDPTENEYLLQMLKEIGIIPEKIEPLN